MRRLSRGEGYLACSRQGALWVLEGEGNVKLEKEVDDVLWLRRVCTDAPRLCSRPEACRDPRTVVRSQHGRSQLPSSRISPKRRLKAIGRQQRRSTRLCEGKVLSISGGGPRCQPDVLWTRALFLRGPPSPCLRLRSGT